MDDTHEKRIYRAGWRLVVDTGEIPSCAAIERALGGFPGAQESGRSKASNFRKMLEVAAEEGLL